jgi:Raf kinase inhibitor-like YbhB/YbcL family protein
LLLVVLTGLVLAGCGDEGSGTSLEQGPSVEGFEFTGTSDVAEGGPIDARFTCDGDGTTPKLMWRGVPEGTEQLALAVEDPDAPGGTFTHWLVYGIDASATSVPATATQGTNDFDDAGYGGPCPPEGEEHDYVFRLLALDAGVDPGSEADRGAFDDAVEGHVIAEARLTAPYRRAEGRR